MTAADQRTISGQEAKILIKNGVIVTSEQIWKADILIRGGSISMVGTEIADKNADTVIEAGGRYIFPGGIDPHTHMHLPVAGGFSSDDFLTGSRAALYGGTTTIIDFVTPGRGESLPAALEKRKREAESSLTDYSFHVTPVEWRKTTGDEIRECIRMGVRSFKVYMAYKKTIGLDDEDIFKVMVSAAKAGGMVTVHCELDDEIEKLRDSYFSAGRTSPLYHALSRPGRLESVAVAKAIEMAAKAGCPLYVVHVSSRDSLIHIREAQSRKQDVFAETCPQYLLLDNSKYEGGFRKTAPFVMSPPLRTREDNEALWAAIADGTISTIGTDHCPLMMDLKLKGEHDFRMIPGGAGGVEHRLALLYTYGVLTKRLNINQMVKVFSQQPAEIFGLYPNKGDIRPGADADLIIWNHDVEEVISVKTHHQNCDTNIYEGLTVKGRPEWVLAGGEVMIGNGKLSRPEKRGRYLFRKPVSGSV